MKELFLGIDLGTSSIKATLADIEGNILDQAQEGYELIVINNTWTEQNPKCWYEGLEKIVSVLGKRNDLSNVQALSFSGQMHGLVILDENDQILRNAILWNDTRTSLETEEINAHFGLKRLTELTGNIAIAGFTAPKILWVKKHEEEIFSRIRKIMLPKDYLAYSLTGNFASDVSDLSGTLLFDVKNKCYQKEMLSYLGITEDLLPKILESNAISGVIKEDFAQKTGLNKNCLVVIGGGDQAMGAIGTGTLKNGSVSISLGTSGVVFAALDDFLWEEKGRMHSFCHANHKYHVMGVMLCAAGSLNWFVESVLNSKDYNGLLSLVDITKHDDLIFLPYLTGERSPINDPSAKGIFYGLDISKDRYDLLRAVITGICFGLKDSLNSLIETGIKPTYARVVGGASKSKEVLQLLANTLGISIKTINTSEGGTLGAIILSINAVHPELSIDYLADRIIKDVEIFKPDCNEFAYLETKFLKYKKLYELTKELNEIY